MKDKRVEHRQPGLDFRYPEPPAMEGVMVLDRAIQDLIEDGMEIYPSEE